MECPDPVPGGSADFRPTGLTSSVASLLGEDAARRFAEAVGRTFDGALIYGTETVSGNLLPDPSPNTVGTADAG